MLKKTLLTTAVCLSFNQLSHASIIANQITGVGPKNDPMHPVLCLQEAGLPVDKIVVHPGCDLAKGASSDGEKCSLSPYYVGGAIRFTGQDKNPCSNKNIYLGYLDFKIWPAKDKKPAQLNEYQVPKEIHINLKNLSIDSEGRVTGQIVYTPIDTNLNLPKAQSNPSNWDFVGVNLSGLEFSNSINPYTVPNLSLLDSIDPKAKINSDLSEITAFIQSGMNAIRVPISWGFLQLEGAGMGELNDNYFDSYVRPILQSLTHAGVYTMLDLHAYMRYSKFGKEVSGCFPGIAKCPDGTVVEDSKAFEDVWLKLYALIKNDPKIDMNYIMFDLMNEPTYDKEDDLKKVPGDFVFTVQANLIKKLREAGFKGYLLVEGSKWSGLHSWDQTWTSPKDGKTYSNAILFSRENFAKAGITDLSKILINVHQYLDEDFSGTHDICRQDIDSVGKDGFNLDIFAKWLETNKLKAMVTEFGTGRNETSCQPMLNKFLQYMQKNSSQGKDYGFSGWTAWSVGHGWGDHYELRIKPDSYHMSVMKNYLKPTTLTNRQ